MPRRPTRYVGAEALERRLGLPTDRRFYCQARSPYGWRGLWRGLPRKGEVPRISLLGTWVNKPVRGTDKEGYARTSKGTSESYGRPDTQPRAGSRGVRRTDRGPRADPRSRALVGGVRRTQRLSGDPRTV